MSQQAPQGNSTKELLSDSRVLDLSTRVSGAYCGLVLEMMGADVVRWDVPLSIDCPESSYAEAAQSLNGGKRVVAAAGAEFSDELESADLVLFDSLDDDDFDGVWAARSREVLGRLPSTTPHIDVGGIRTGDGRGDALPATSLTVGAFSGMSWAIGDPDDAPLSLPFDIPAYLAGVEAAGAAALALLLRQSSASPQRWGVSSADVLASYVGQISSNFLPYGRPWARDGARASMSGGFYPAAMFRCSDGFVSLFCRTNREWANLLTAMGNPEWAKQPGYEDGRIVARLHADVADVHMKAWVADKSSEQMSTLARQYGFPIAKVLSVNQARDVEQFHVRGLMGSSEGAHPRVVGPPWYVQVAEQAAPRPPTLRPTAEAPLAGLKVLDLTWVWSGPMVTAALADLGADVIKVEGLNRPDPSRLRGAGRRDGVPVPGPDLEVSPYFNQMNRGKRSVGIDISTDRGAELVRELAAGCDVVIENMRPGALGRRGLAYEDLRQVNPGVVMFSMSMMGQSGPLRDVGGYAPVMSGLTGLDSLVGYTPERLIGLYNPALGDPNGAAHALALLLSALAHRARTGKGSWLDLSQVECLLSILRVPVLLADNASPVPPPANAHSRFGPHGTFRAAGNDSWVAVAARTDLERQRLAAVLECESAALADLEPALLRWLIERPAQACVKELASIGVPAAEVVGVEAVLARPGSRPGGLHHSVEHAYLGSQEIFGLTWRLGSRSFIADAPSPVLGQHSREVLAQQLGLGEQVITGLIDAGVVTESAVP